MASSCVLRCNIFFVCCLLGRRSLGRIQQTDINIHIAPRTQTGRRRSRVRDDDDDELVANPQHTPPGRGPFFSAIAFCWFCLAAFWTAKGSLPAYARARGGGGGVGLARPGGPCVCVDLDRPVVATFKAMGRSRLAWLNITNPNPKVRKSGAVGKAVLAQDLDFDGSNPFFF